MEGRGYVWHQISDTSAYLEGPEPHVPAALIVPAYGEQEEGQIGYRVMSNTSAALNYLETEIFDLDLMVRAVNIRLMNVLKKEESLLEEDMGNVRYMIFQEYEDDPYA